MKVSRRAILAGGAIAASSVALGAGVRSSSEAFSLFPLRPSTFDLVHEQIQVALPERPKLSPLRGLRIGFAADLHLGLNVPAPFLKSAIEKLLRDKIDLMLWGGDYIAVNGSTLSRISTATAHRFSIDSFQREAQLKPILEDLPQIFRLVADSKIPSYAVNGNHELWVAPDRLAKLLAGERVSLLVNQTHRLDLRGLKIEIAGSDDYWNGVPTPPIFSTEADYRIFLCHNPDYVELLERHGLVNFDLALCGHTHGGQCKAPLVGALTYNIGGRLREGLYHLTASRFPTGSPTAQPNGRYFPEISAAYVSRGLGVVELPFRVNCQPEVTSIILT